jgi:hypothetical protein
MIRKIWPPNKWLLTTQREHARVAGLIASFWNFTDSRPHEDVQWAAAHHEDGWAEYDENPALNRKGEPAGYLECDAATLTGAWGKSIQMALDADRPYAARLIAALFADYAQNLNLSRFSAKEALEIGRFIFTARKRSEAAGESSADSEAFRRDLHFLQVCDAISTALASDFTGEMPIENVPYTPAPHRLVLVRKRADSLSGTITPLPFKKNFRDHFHSFVVDQRTYTDREDLKSALQGIKPLMNEIHVGAQT